MAGRGGEPYLWSIQSKEIPSRCDDWKGILGHRDQHPRCTGGKGSEDNSVGQVHTQAGTPGVGLNVDLSLTPDMS